MQALDRLGSVYQHANLPQHHWLEFLKKKGGGGIAESPATVLPEQRIPSLLSFFNSTGSASL